MVEGSRLRVTGGGTMVERRLIAVEGVVQGVGFRPYVHRLAAANGLRGSVRNGDGGVLIDVEGTGTDVDAFCHSLTRSPPPLARIERLHVTSADPAAHADFRIAESVAASPRRAAAPVPVDVATCAACVSELRDPGNRRCGHPFITCTDCGPRFTIVQATPFDRTRTTMARFPMCADCRSEYANPSDRRFHAEAIACWNCGPTLRAIDARTHGEHGAGRDAVAAAITALRDGAIVAVKALGGYHLACDATSALAVARLRARKHRPAKPLAIMVADVAAAAALCHVSRAEHALLDSRARPIVLLARRGHTHIAAGVAPGQQALGVMLPSTPVHHLLARLGRPLVMTSGNCSGDPVVIDERAAFATLAGVADLFLTHDRPIAARCDDSIAQVVAGRARFLRRARGRAPRAVGLSTPSSAPVLAAGAHLKNTACFIAGTAARMSAHIGDLESASARAAWRDAVDGMLHDAGVRPAVVAHDLHQEYGSTQLAHSLATELGVVRTVAVQHHHAHVAACVAEHGVDGAVIGVAFDGSGLGTDGAIWGGEFLLVHGAGFERRGHLAYVPLPGGDAAARHPWRVAAAHAAAAGCALPAPPGDDVTPREWHGVRQLLDRPASLPQTSSAGRLFDAVASLLGLCHVSRFEGEAAMALQAVADPAACRGYDVRLLDGACWTVDVGGLFRSVMSDVARGVDAPIVAGAFHHALRDVIVAGCMRVRDETGVHVVALGGGVFTNALLLSLTIEALASRGFRVLAPAAVPCNDGGLSLGQAWVAARALDEEATCA